MKLLLIIILQILIVASVYSQFTRINKLNVLFNDPLKSVEFVDEDQRIIKITDLYSGYSTYKNISNVNKFTPDNTAEVSKTVINLFDIDTTLYSGMLEQWARVDLSTWILSHLYFDDINNNGLLEVYGSVIDVEHLRGNFLILEYDSSFQSYTCEHQYPEEPDSICVENTLGLFGGIYDVNGNGRKQVYLQSGCATEHNSGYSPYRRGKVYSNTNDFDLPVYKDFEHVESGQMYYSRFGDFNNNGKTDLIYGVGLGVKIFEYNQNVEGLDFVYSTHTNDHVVGFFIGDLDNDGFSDITFGNTDGNLYALEYSPQDTSYKVKYFNSLDTKNLYLHFGTNDIDGNGKKEFWAGGDIGFMGDPRTNIYCFEPVGLDSYEMVHEIEIIDLFTFSPQFGVAADLNGDGVEEIILCLENTIFIFQFTGTQNNHEYSILYCEDSFVYNPPSSISNMSLTVYDVDRDQKEEIVISKEEFIRFDHGGFDVKSYSKIYKLNTVTKVENADYSEYTFKLLENYPNPFNPSTTISYSLAEKSYVSLDVYNILGQKVTAVVDKEQPVGTYKVEFNAEDLPSGVYFYRLQAGEFIQSKKMLLMK